MGKKGREYGRVGEGGKEGKISKKGGRKEWGGWLKVIWEGQESIYWFEKGGLYWFII